MIPIPLAQRQPGDNTDLLANILFRKSEQERLNKERDFELLNSALGNTSNVVAAGLQQKNQQDRIQSLAQLAARGDEPAMLELGITPPSMRSPHPQLTPSQIETNEAAKARGRASVTKPPSPSDLTPEEFNALRQATLRKNNPLAPSMINFRGPRAKIMAQALMNDPNWSPTGAEASLGAAKAGAEASARLTQGGSAQMTARTANAAKAQLSILKEISDKFPRSDVQALNTPIIALNKQIYPEAQNWVLAINSFRTEYASALMRGHMPQQQAMEEANRAIPENITARQLDAAIPLLGRLLDATVKGQMTPAGAGRSEQAPPVAPSGADLESIAAKHGIRL